jgi:hypothetical protein
MSPSIGESRICVAALHAHFVAISPVHAVYADPRNPILPKFFRPADAPAGTPGFDFETG